MTGAIYLALGNLQFTFDMMLALASTLVAAFGLVLAARSSLGGPIVISFWAFILVWNCVGTVAQLGSQTFPWPDNVPTAEFAPANLVFIVAGLAYGAGLRLARRVGDERVAPGEQARPRLLIPLAIVLLLAVPVLRATGGLAARFQTRLDVGRAIEASGLAGDTITLFFLNRLPAASLLVLAYGAAYAFAHRRNRGDLRYWVMLAMTIGLVAIFANPYSTSRYAAFGVLGAFILGLIDVRTQGRRLAFAAVSTVGLLTAYPLAAYFKRQFVDRSVLALGKDTFTSTDFDGFQTTVNMLTYVEAHGYQYGRHVVAAVLFWVPRQFWPEKPIPASFEISQFRGYSFQNLGLPIWAELYLDLTIVGMALAMVLYGYVSRRLDMVYVAEPKTAGAHFAVLIAVAQFGLIRGPLGGSVVFFGSVLVVGLLVYLPVSGIGIGSRRGERR